MEEGATHKASKAENLDVFSLGMRRPYIFRLASSAGIGGFLIGYNTGGILGALLNIRDEFPEVQKKVGLQETIVSMAVAGAILGGVLAGWMNNKFGRKRSILAADLSFFLGALLMVFAPGPWLIIVGILFVGLGVGMASMTAPLYISETSPARIKGALVSFNRFHIIGGQFMACLNNLLFAKVLGTWRWTFVKAGTLALVQFLTTFLLPESPRWLYRKDKTEEAIDVLKAIYSTEELDEEVQALKSSVKTEVLEEGFIDTSNIFAKVKDAWRSPIVRKGLAVGIGVQIFQQSVGSNAVIYYIPAIVQFAGIASNNTAILLSLIPFGLGALGTIACMGSVDKYGRKKLMIISMIGIIACFCGLAVVFKVSDVEAPNINGFETAHFGNNSCPAYFTTPNEASWSSRSCLDASSYCAFCSNSRNWCQPGGCVAIDSTSETVWHSRGRSEFFTEGCPSRATMAAIVFLGFISCSYGMGAVPWMVNSEIYPFRHRSICVGIATMASWISNLIVSQMFFSLIKVVGFSCTFLLFAVFSTLGLLYMIWIVPETKGLSLEEIVKMFEVRSMLHPWRKKPQLSEERKPLILRPRRQSW